MKFSVVGIDGAPAVKLVYTSEERAERYLTDEGVAEQFSGANVAYSLNTGQSVTIDGTTLCFGHDVIRIGEGDFLFEGSGAGTGTLNVEFIAAGAVIAHDRVFLQLQPAVH